MEDSSDRERDDLTASSLSRSLESRLHLNATGSRSQQQPKNTTQRRRRKRRPLSTQQRHQRFVREVRQLANSKHSMIPRLPFSRLVREIMMQRSLETRRITLVALEALQESCELYLTQFFSDAYMLSFHRGRVTLMPKDLRLLLVLKNSII